MLERLREKKRYVFVFLLSPLKKLKMFQKKTPHPKICFLFIIYFVRLQLREFSDKVIDTKAAGYCVPQYASAGGGGVGGAGGGTNAQMEVDSNASTPA
jgi:hypothetical protein